MLIKNEISSPLINCMSYQNTHSNFHVVALLSLELSKDIGFALTFYSFVGPTEEVALIGLC